MDQRSQTLIENLQYCQTMSDAWQLLDRDLKELGFDYALYYFTPLPPRRSHAVEGLVFSSYDDDFIRPYTDLKMADYDWNIEHCMTHTHARRWNTDSLISSLSDQQMKLAEFSWDLGTQEGLVVPVRDSRIGGHGGVGLNAMGRTERDLSAQLADQQEAIHGLLMAFHAYVLSRGMLNAYELTPREHEVLKHMVCGRRDTEIGDILHCSDRTSEAHRRSIRRKLKASNDAHAVAKALIANLVAP